MSISFSLTKNYQNKKVTQPIMIDEGTNFFSPIHNTPLTKLPPENWTQNLSPKLPPQNIIQYKKKKKTLILDLDETLVHSSMNPFPKCADITLPINFMGRNIFIYVLKRPFLEKFLEEMNLIYDIIIFTASLPEYSEPLLDIIDKNKVIKLRLNRSHCRHYQNIYIKDLKVINRNLKDMIIIDNNPESYLMNKENAIPILTWEDDINDNELIKLIPVLKYLANVDDVRNVINQIVDRNNEKVNFNAFNKIIKINNNLNSNNHIIRNNQIITNNNIINSNNNINNNILSPKDNNIRNNKNNININYNINKKIYIKKEISDNNNINKRISLPTNTNNQFILNNKNIKPIEYNNKPQINLAPKDTIRKTDKRNSKLNLDVVDLKNQYKNNIDLNNKNKFKKDNNIKERINTSPINQINVSNSTINIFNNKPEIKILVNGPVQKPDINKIRKIKEGALTPIRTAKNKRIIFNADKNKNNIVTPIKENYNNIILTNPNYGKTNVNKMTKTVTVRKLFDQSNHSFDNIFFNPKDLQKYKNTKIKNFDMTYNSNGFAYNPNIANYIKNINVKNNFNIPDNNKVIKMTNFNNNLYNNNININNNYNNKNYLRSEKSMSDLNKAIKINNIEVIKPKRNVKITDKRKYNINMKIKDKENKIYMDYNNNNKKLTKKIIMERESFNRAKFLKENFGIVDS